MLNNHFQQQFDSNNCSLLPNDVRDNVLGDFEIMSNLGIDNDKDQNEFFLIRNHVPELLYSIFNHKINDKTAQAIAAEVFRSREKHPIGSLLELIEAIDLALKKMLPEDIRPKIAYPQPTFRAELPKYDINRWVIATRKIYALMSKSNTRQQAEDLVTGEWEPREKMDYKNWLKFYEEKVPEKYPKLAYDEGFMFNGIPVDALRGRVPMPTAGQGHAAKVPPGLPQERYYSDVDEVRDRIESQRRKLISRLNSAEKMLSDMEGQMFAGAEHELILKLLQDLKRKIQTTNKRTVKSTIFEDYIYRTANELKSGGKNKAADFFYKIAQLPPVPDTSLNPSGTPPDLSADVGSMPSGSEGNKEETKELLKEFFDNLKRGVQDPDDTPEEREAAKTSSDDQIQLGNGFWSFAQLAPQPKPLQKDVVLSPPGIKEDNTDDVIDAALKNISISDVIRRLEMLVSIYNQREISRQLAILDIMMDRIGLASYFPQLGEAMSKALEANQYIGSRLEGVLTKVKGSMDAPGASEWIEVVPQNSPETAAMRQRLDQEKKKEDERREMRKQQDLAKLQGGVAPQQPQPNPIGEEAELQRPSRVEKAPKLEVR